MAGFFEDIGKGLQQAADEANKITSDVVKTVVKGTEDAAGAVFHEAGKTLNLSYTKDLHDTELLKLLVQCANNCYSFNENDLKAHPLKLTYKQEQNETSENIKNLLQYGVYEIINGKHKGKRVLAYRGTASLMGILQDASLINPAMSPFGSLIHTTNQHAVRRANDHKPDFITGHSLGAFIAECVCAATGIPGAAFNAPGPWAANPLNNCAVGDKYRGVPFEIHLVNTDLVSHYGSVAGPNSSHIGTPKWHDVPGRDDPLTSHAISTMVTIIHSL